MAIGVGFASDEYEEKSIEDYYEEELSDTPIGAGGFVKDICYEKAAEQYLESKKYITDYRTKWLKGDKRQ